MVPVGGVTGVVLMVVWCGTRVGGGDGVVLMWRCAVLVLMRWWWRRWCSGGVFVTY